VSILDRIIVKMWKGNVRDGIVIHVGMHAYTKHKCPGQFESDISITGSVKCAFIKYDIS